MSSIETLLVIESMNSGNFIESHYDSENHEFVAYFRNANINIPDYCYRAHGRIYDGEEDRKVCRVEVK